MKFFNGSSFSNSNGFMDSKNLKNSAIFSFDEEEKKTASRSFLSSLLSKRMVIPMLGVLYVVLLLRTKNILYIYYYYKYLYNFH
ncbi:hypothetical protein PFUGPA_04248 [Plasmodium falciparum Palo Alto/Uganda]|uniref:Uncharacterized protein n=1 Tax=Plasmodium falciparum (isolate Palo Alto / Uganda) TaxID=57270 RepID=W4IX37_PLAFP|nr:hypothetical protein PFUGPA_04248 [Plasmodium falciparum Palo Alto/Uganda]